MIAFKEFLETSIRKEFKQKIEEIEKAEKEKRRMNDIRVIKSERDFFRQEAIRLNELCKELGAKIEQLSFDLKFQTGELMNMTKKWKESENMNKQLIFELERNIQFTKELDDRNNNFLKDTKVNFDDYLNNNINNNENHNGKNEYDLNKLESENIANFNQDKLMKIIEKLKVELKKEKIRNHKILSEFNRLTLNRDQFEKIFESCVEEMKREIHSRKLKELSHVKTNSILKELKEIKLEQFQNIDKRKIIEKFILNDQVVIMLKEHLSNKKPEESSIMKFHKTSSDFNKTQSTLTKTDFKFRTNSKFKIHSLNNNNNRIHSVYNRSQLLI